MGSEGLGSWWSKVVKRQSLAEIDAALLQPAMVNGLVTKVRFPWVKPNERQNKMGGKVMWTKVDDIKIMTGWIWK